MVSLLLLMGCLEKVSGEDIPLDCRFYGCKEQGAGVGPEGGDGQPEGPGGAGEAPWSGVTGDKIKITGVIASDQELDVQVDVNEIDANAPGGQKRVGALHIPVGEFELEVPKTVTSFRMEAFQDPDSDGPSATDPYAEILIDLSAGPPRDLRLELKEGARSTDGQPSAAPPGAPGGGGGGGPGAPGGTGGQPSQDDPFGNVDKITLSGTVTAPTALPVKIDLFKVDPAVPGGRTFIVKAEAKDGQWTLKVPKDYGAVELDAYQDPGNDGPSATDPRGRLAAPLTVAGDDIGGLAIEVK